MGLNTKKAVRFAGLLTGCSLAALSQNVSAQSDSNSGEFEEIVITASGSRLPADVTSIPGSVTILSLAEIQKQSGISSDLGAILAKSVPGMAPSSNDGNNFAQTIRGRKPAFFLDGIPQSAALRGGGRDMRIIHPNVLERVEVIRGSTSIYGQGGSGGVINYITKRPAEEGYNFFTEIGFSTSLSNIDDRSFSYTGTQGISAKEGKFDIVANITYQSRGLYFDGDGDLIPPDPAGQTGIADMDEWSLFAKVGYDFTPTVRLELMGVYFDAEVDTDYTVGQGSFAAGVKSVGEIKSQNNIVLGPYAFDFVGVQDPENDNKVIAASLILDDVAGSSVKLQTFYQDSYYVWRHLDYLGPGVAGFPPEGSQLSTSAEKKGLRLDVNTPVTMGGIDGFVLWGVDYLKDETEERLLDGRIRSAGKQNSLSFFGQAQLDITDDLHIRGGLRYDDFKLTIPDFEAIDWYTAITHPIVGADLNYSNLSGNFGIVYDFTDNLNVFASWSSGFSVGNVLRTIGGLRPSGFSPVPVTYYVADLGKFTEAVAVDSYEGGLRYSGEVVSASIAAFYSTSDLGASFDPVTFETVRAPERIWGLELTADVNVTDKLRVGGSFSIQDSKTDADSDGVFEGPLDFSRVPPPMLTTYVEVDFFEGWSARLQSNTLFDESRFTAPFNTSQRDVEGYTLFDLLVSGPFLGGTINLGVENLLNKQYFPLVTLMNCSDSPIFDTFCATAAPGAIGSVRYKIEF
ncbi:TonB-dependent receptor [Kordiimonas pumila]|uniref:TonB-dependent receptor n=1 Tax=Kordiimonas pumila TaxID=2161677 RepID=A0ABV7D6S7_9PROT|nr:TonB-dependent receptor [Kordiimonas pumila]